jgi:hypothetical protein
MRSTLNIKVRRAALTPGLKATVCAPQIVMRDAADPGHGDARFWMVLAMQ